MKNARDPLLERAHTAILGGRYEQAMAALDERDAELSARGLGDTPEAARGWGRRIVAMRLLGDIEASVRLGERRVATARRRRWDEVRAQVLRSLALSVLELRDNHRAEQLLDEALDLADELDDPVLISGVCRAQALLWSRRGVHARADASIARAVETARAAGDHHGLGYALLSRGRAAVERGRYPEAAEDLDEAIRLFEDDGTHFARCQALMARTQLALHLDDVDLAGRLTEQTLDLARRVGVRTNLGLAHNEAGEVCRLRGETEQARHHYQQSCTLLERDSPHVLVPSFNLALMELTAGDVAAARTRLESLVARSHTQRRRAIEAISHVLGLAISGVEADEALWAEHLTLARIRLRETRLVEPDAGRLALVAAEGWLAEGSDDGLGRAAVSTAIAMRQLGDNPREKERLTALLDTLRERGAPIPVGPFLARRTLGTGGMGEVLEGSHPLAGSRVALKVLRGEFASRPRAVELFEHEMRMVAGLSHPSIISVLDYGACEDIAAALSDGRLSEASPYLALEYAGGGTLHPWCGRLEWPVVNGVLLALLDALAHAHARGVIHLDIKPDNVLLVDATHPLHGIKLADFGLARLRGEHHEGVAGTPQFMAPEQFRPIARPGPWTDLYALGCLAWALVTGAPLFPAGPVHELERAHCHRSPPPLQPVVAVPEGLDAWLAGLLEKAPEDRYQRAADAAIGLLSLAGAPLEAPRGSVARAGTVSETLIPGEADTLLTLVLEQDFPVEPSAPTERSLPPPSTAPIPTLPGSWHTRTPVSPPPVPDTGLRLVAARRPRTIHRDREQAALWRLLARVVDDRASRVVVFRGPEGVGKERLGRWLSQRAHEAGVAEVFLHRADTGLPPEITAERPEDVLFRIERVRGRRVAILVLDDADPLALRIVDQVLASAPEGVLVLLPARHSPVAEAERLARIVADPWSFVIDLRPLPATAIRAILEEVVPLEAELGEALVERADGNPGLARALLLHLAATGGLVPGRRGYRLRTGETIELSPALRARFEAILAELAPDPADQDALRLAAALGPIVDEEEWRALVGGRADLDALSWRLVNHAVLARRESEWRWIQPTLREVLLEQPGTRLAHLACADLLAGRTGRADARIGTHLVAARQYEEALNPLFTAIEDAIERGDDALGRRLYGLWAQAIERLALASDDRRRLAVESLRPLIHTVPGSDGRD